MRVEVDWSEKYPVYWLGEPNLLHKSLQVVDLPDELVVDYQQAEERHNIMIDKISDYLRKNYPDMRLP